MLRLEAKEKEHVNEPGWAGTGARQEGSFGGSDARSKQWRRERILMEVKSGRCEPSECVGELYDRKCEESGWSVRDVRGL